MLPGVLCSSASYNRASEIVAAAGLAVSGEPSLANDILLGCVLASSRTAIGSSLIETEFYHSLYALVNAVSDNQQYESAAS